MSSVTSGEDGAPRQFEVAITDCAWSTGPEPVGPGRITVVELARRLGVSRHAAYRLLEAGAIPGAFKVNGTRRAHWFIPGDAPEKFLARSEGAA
jgi:excisionase family DNA binding protein